MGLDGLPGLGVLDSAIDHLPVGVATFGDRHEAPLRADMGGRSPIRTTANESLSALANAKIAPDSSCSAERGRDPQEIIRTRGKTHERTSQWADRATILRNPNDLQYRIDRRIVLVILRRFLAQLGQCT